MAVPRALRSARIAGFLASSWKMGQRAPAQVGSVPNLKAGSAASIAPRYASICMPERFGTRK